MLKKLADDLWLGGERPIKPGDSWFSPESYLGSAS